MHVITGRNVNVVYSEAMELVRQHGVPQASRAGDVLAVPHPVVLVTQRPQERVLLDAGRDANPFFHLFEALWMLAGRNDSAFLDRFVRDFGSRFAEEDGIVHGAYGHRWRGHFGFDQLDYVVERLVADPLDRQVVIQMWDPGVDTNGGGAWYGGKPRDIPCNDIVLPRIVDGALDLMVCCRSNDVVWGACGANAVHFSFLLEYLAGRIGCQVGCLRQMTTNLHGYTATLLKVGDPDGHDPYDELLSRMQDQPVLGTVSIGTDWEHWDKDLLRFLSIVESGEGSRDYHDTNQWFEKVAYPMWYAHAYRREYKIAMDYARLVAAPDWSLAAQQWLSRRIGR